MMNRSEQIPGQRPRASSKPRDALSEELEATRRRLRELEEEVEAASSGDADEESTSAEPVTQTASSDQQGELFPEGFEVFKERWVPASRSKPRVAIQRRGNMSLNRAAMDALGGPSHVVFAHNAAAGEFAIRAANDIPYASPVRRQQNADSYLVTAKAFLGRLGLVNEDDVLVFDSVEARDGLLVVDMAQARRVHSRRRGEVRKEETQN